LVASQIAYGFNWIEFESIQEDTKPLWLQIGLFGQHQQHFRTLMKQWRWDVYLGEKFDKPNYSKVDNSVKLNF
jgi:hypothetical protein